MNCSKQPVTSCDFFSGGLASSLTLGLQNARSVNAPNRFSSIVSEIFGADADVFCITETWLRDNEPLPDGGLSSAGYSNVLQPRSGNKRGGGLAIIYKSIFSVKHIFLATFDSFEQLTVLFSLYNKPLFTLTLLYRSPCTSQSVFIHEFDDLLEQLCSAKNHIVLGDFNLHVDNSGDSYVMRFGNVLQQYSYFQHVQEPTHSGGHTLDLVISRLEDGFVRSVTVHDYNISDHSFVLCMLASGKSFPCKSIKQVRSWKKANLSEFMSEVSTSVLCDMEFLRNCPSVSDLVLSYNTILLSLVDKHVPLVALVSTSRQRVPWFSRELRDAIRKRRKLERLWRKTRTVIHRADFVHQRNIVKTLVLSSKRSFYTDYVKEHSQSSRDLWNAISTLLHKKQPPVLPSVGSDVNLAAIFADSFLQKLNTICESLSPSCGPSNFSVHPTSLVFDHFDRITIDETFLLIINANGKSCISDPVPTWLIKMYPAVFAPIFCHVINLSLESGIFPVSEKCAIVTPLLKKKNLDKDDFNNYRPVSQLSFVSKLIERAVSSRVNAFISSNMLLSPFQSAYRKCHSTDTVLVHLCNEISVYRSMGLSTCLLLLDLSAAFDTVNHDILINRLSSCFLFSGTVLNWFSSYLSDRSQHVFCDGQWSDVFSMSCGVPQGSVLGPMLYSMYVSPISAIINCYNLPHHVYADDTCILTSFSTDCLHNLYKFEECIDHVCDWFNWNRLKLNTAKTDLIVFHPCQSNFSPETSFQINVCGHSVKPSACVKYLGVLCDSDLSFDRHIIEICKFSFIFLRSIYRIRRYLTHT